MVDLIFSDSGMFCNASCSYPELNLSTDESVCRKQSCSFIKVQISNQNLSCLTSSADLQDFKQTNSSIWLESPANSFHTIGECYYNGCIRSLICKPSCSKPFCDGALSPIYSSTGMTCNVSCSFPEFNLSTSQQICKNESCTTYTVVVSSTQSACIALFSELSSNSLTSQ